MKTHVLSTARLSFPLASAIAALLSASSTQADSIYWDGTSASWNLNTNWATDPLDATVNPLAIPGAADDAIFNITTVNGAQTITMGANQAVNSMTFNNTGTTAITGGGTARTLSLGAGGITMASGAGAVTLGSGAAGNNVLLNLAGAQTWTNNTANAFTINNTVATFTRQTGATLTFNKASTGNFAISTTAAPLVNSIIGSWAFFGTGANQRYANITSGNVTGLTGTTSTGLSVTGSTTNYEVSGSALTLGGGNYTSNTIRYAGTGASFNFTNSGAGGSTHTTNGILAVGASGTLTLRNSNTTDDSRLIIGSAGELVIAGQQAVTISVPIAEGAAGRGLTYSGTNTLILSGVNTYTGATTVSSGTLRLSNSLALQNSSLNTSGSIAGDSTNGLKTTLTALTLGGLTGDKNLASLFTTNAGGYNTVAGLTLNPGSGASHSYSGVIANGAANMTLTKTGLGTQILSGVNTYTGATTISAGTLILNNATALGTTPGTNGTSSISMAAGTTLSSDYIIADAGNVDSFVYAPITLTGTGSVNFHIGAGNATLPAEAVTFNLNGAIGGTAGTNVVFSTTGSLNNPDSTFVLGAASTYDGNTTITVGNNTERLNVKAGVANALPSTTVLTFGNTVGSGTGRTNQYDLNGNDQTLAGLSNGGVVPNLRNQRVTNSGTLATLTINNSDDFTFGGSTLSSGSTTRAQIMGNIALVKSGAGTFTLGGTLTGGATVGSNTYTGATTINGGVLEAQILANGGSASSIGQSTNAAANLVFGAPTATLRYTGSSNVTINRGFTLSSGAGGGATIESSGAGTLSLNNTVAIAYGTTDETRTLTLGGSNTGTNTFGKVIADNGTGATSLVKNGVGTWVLDQNNTYAGNTTISGGTLALAGSGSIASSPTIIVGVNTTFDVSAVTGGYSLTTDQTISGTGTVAGAMSVSGTLSPGNSPGILTTGSQTWLDGGDYNFQMLDASGAAGTGFDQIAVTGTLDLSSLTAGGFNINLWSLSSILPDVNGDALSFNNALTQSWTILTTTTGITGFDAANFIINVGANNGTNGFSNALGGGGFSLGTASNNLVLTFTAVPEPNVAALLGGLGALALLRRRR